MLYNMDWHITLGGFKLMMLDSVEITRSVEQLSDTAVITLPGSVFNKALEIEDKIKRGDAVVIKLGYNGDLTTEFEGFIEAIESNDDSLTVKCEDGIYQLRKPVENIEFTNPELTDILGYVLQQAGGYGLNCSYQFRYDKFTIINNTAYGVVKKIQEETKANVYLKDGVLHVHPQYKEIFGEATYSFQHNIESSELEYRRAEDRKTEVVVEGKDASGKVIRETAGEKGGDTITIKIEGVSDRASLKTMAEEQLKTKNYTGYSGSFTGWLVPWCDAGYKATITDRDYEYKDGTYYVLEVVTTFSKAGGAREIKIGMKL